MIKHLLCKSEVLSSNPSPVKKKSNFHEEEPPLCERWIWDETVLSGCHLLLVWV
jgi:hypothetical protein